MSDDEQLGYPWEVKEALEDPDFRARNPQKRTSAMLEDLAGEYAALSKGRTLAQEKEALEDPNIDLYPSLVQVLAEEAMKGTKLPDPLVENTGSTDDEMDDAETLEELKVDGKKMHPMGRSSDYILQALKLAHGEDDSGRFRCIFVAALTDEQREWYAEHDEPLAMQVIWDIVRKLPRT